MNIINNFTEKAKMRVNIYIVILILTIFSCKKDGPTCKERSQDTGEIISDLWFGDCFYLMNKTSYVITSIHEFQSLTNQVDSAFIVDALPGCDTVDLPSPNIDFEEYSIIGQYTEGRGCSSSLDRDVTIDYSNNKYVYRINGQTQKHFL